MSSLKHRLALSTYREGITRGDRVILSRAITLTESTREEDQRMSDKLIQAILPTTGKAIRIGITGSPGVGKSTFIEAFGQYLIHMTKKIAVLTIDPSSRLTQGSILGDKTRMEKLVREKNAFIRPTATGMNLGGVHDRTREVMLLCEAAGFDVIIVETVGIGQLEVDVHEMVDFFMLLILGGSGDELQGIKRGIMEMADGIVITKSDGDNIKKAKEARDNYQRVLRFFPPSPAGWMPKVLLSSAVENKGMEAIWNSIQEFKRITSANGAFKTRRAQQIKAWFSNSIDNQLKYEIEKKSSLKKGLSKLEDLVTSGMLTPTQAARKFLEQYISISLPNRDRNI